MLRFYNTPESKTRTKALHKEPHPISSLHCAIPPGKIATRHKLRHKPQFGHEGALLRC
jgi:hypothetical protein